MIGEGSRSDKTESFEVTDNESNNKKVLSNNDILQAMKNKARLFVTSDDTKVHPKPNNHKVKRKAVETKIKPKKFKTPPKYFSFKD